MPKPPQPNQFVPPKPAAIPHLNKIKVSQAKSNHLKVNLGKKLFWGWGASPVSARDRRPWVPDPKSNSIRLNPTKSNLSEKLGRTPAPRPQPLRQAPLKTNQAALNKQLATKTTQISSSRVNPLIGAWNFSGCWSLVLGAFFQFDL